jgi:hypothetical protein
VQPLVRRCCEFIGGSDAELERAVSRAIFLHERDKCQTVEGISRVKRELNSGRREFTEGRRERCSVGTVA